ncbi:hypothetical protein BgiMline_036477, partial [Biomphalaria glabrata]
LTLQSKSASHVIYMSHFLSGNTLFHNQKVALRSSAVYHNSLSRMAVECKDMKYLG